VREGSQVGRTVVLVGRTVTIGRSVASDLPLQDDAVSRRHCRIYWAGGSYMLEDLGSSNGTYLNGTRVDRAPLRDGDFIQAGDQVLEFAISDEL